MGGKPRAFKRQKYIIAYYDHICHHYNTQSIRSERKFDRRLKLLIS